MPRNNFEFEDDDVNDRVQKDEGGIEVDLSQADKDDGEDAAFEGLGTRKLLQRPKQVKDEDSDDGEDELDTSAEEPGNDDLDIDEDELGPRGRAPKSGSWRKRLLRAERLIEEVRDENKALTARGDALEAQHAKRETETQVATKRAEAETKLAKIRTDLAAAKEAGNTADEIRLTEEMADIKADVKVAEQALANAKAADAAAPPVQRQPRLAKQWMRKHQRYNTDAPFKAFVQEIDKQVAAEGYDMNADEYWEELDRRVSKRYPEEYKRREAGPRRRHPASGAEADESQGGIRKEEGGFRRTRTGVMLSPSQLSNMRRFGLDPESKEDRAAYVKNNLKG